MRNFDFIRTTTDSRTYRLLRRLTLDAHGRCSYCPSHGGHCNSKSSSYYRSRSHSRSKARYTPRIA